MRRANLLAVMLCILAVGIDIITKALTDVKFALSKPAVLVWTTEVTHHIVEMIAAFFT